MTPEAKEVLGRIGTDLDQDRFPIVHNGGIVMPSNPAADPVLQGLENRNERKGRQKRPPAEPRQRTAGRKGPAAGSRPTGAAPRLGSDLRTAYEEQLTTLAGAYPTARIIPDDQGMWLLVRSSILSGFDREATFLVALPFRRGAGPRAWGFWSHNQKVEWIGPRHTNFQDGSICAFSPDDEAWSEGRNLIMLIDLYTVWALRHLHLDLFGRWPGKQYALLGADPRLQAYYRRIECKDNELCGCGSAVRRYADCCKPSDSQWDEIELMSLFLRFIPGGFNSRQPPAAVRAFVEGSAPTLPPISTLISGMPSG